MAKFCPSCGVSVQSGAKFCSECGSALESQGTIQAGGLKPNVVAFLCYLAGFVSGAIFLNLDPYRRDPEIRFHAWQSIFFALTWVGLSVLEGLFHFVVMHFWFVMWFFHVGVFVLWVILLVKAYNGEHFKIPFLGDLAEQKASGK